MSELQVFANDFELIIYSAVIQRVMNDRVC